MAIKINRGVSRTNTPQEVKEIGHLVQLSFNTRLTKGQKKAGVVAKCTMNHPAFVATFTMFKSKKGKLRVQTPSTKIGEKSYYNFITLDKGIAGYIIREYKKFAENGRTTPWYRDYVGEHKFSVTEECENKELDISEIIVTDELTAGQRKAGVACKVSLVTEVGTLRSYTIFESKFGEAVFGSEPAENPDETRDKQVSAYRLTKGAEAQILNYIHANAEFEEDPDIPEEDIDDDEDFEDDEGMEVEESQASNFSEEDVFTDGGQ